MNALVVYYSLSGTTRKVAATVAKGLGADIEEIRCERYSSGFFGFIRAGYDSWKGRLPPIKPLSKPLSRYGLVVIGGPIWAFHPATPLRSFLRNEAPKLGEVAFILTHGGSAAEQSLREMEQLAGRMPKATLVVREVDVRTGKFVSAVSSFVSSLRADEGHRAAS